jgi:hypothetical protein
VSRTDQLSPWSPAAIAPSPPGIRITLARGAFGFIKTAREPPMLTVSSAKAEPLTRPTSVGTAAKKPVHCCRFMMLPVQFENPMSMNLRRAWTLSAGAILGLDGNELI